MPHARRWAPQLHRLLPCQTKAPHDQAQTEQRNCREEPLPPQIADTCSALRAPVICDNAYRMYAKKNNQAQDQIGHDDASSCIIPSIARHGTVNDFSLHWIGTCLNCAIGAKIYLELQ